MVGNVDWKGILQRAVAKGHVGSAELITLEKKVAAAQDLSGEFLDAALVRRLAALGKLTAADTEFLGRFDHRSKQDSASETWDNPDTLSTVERPEHPEDFSSTQPLTDTERRSIQSAKDGLGEVPFLENYRMETKVGKGGYG